MYSTEYSTPNLSKISRCIMGLRQQAPGNPALTGPSVMI
jgi:hypothetical protein